MKFVSRRIGLFLLLGSVLFALACGSGSSFDAEARITVDEGGELRSEDGSFVLTVPAGAVSEDVTISLEEISSEEADDGILNVEGPRFELKPDGLQFSEPARVTLRVPVDDLDAGPEGNELPTFNIVSLSSDGDLSGLENVDNSFDLTTSELTLSADVSHFSRIFRTKRNFTVELTRITEPLAIGEPRVLIAQARANTPSVNHSLNWTLEALSNVRLEPSQTDAVQVNQVQRGVLTPVSDSARVVGEETLLESGGFDNLFVTSRLICISLGTGIYSFSMTATPMREGITAVNLRPVSISVTATVTCVGVAEATATARVRADQTAVGGTPDIIPTPTFGPFTVPTATPTVRVVPTATPRPTQIPVPTSTPTAGEVRVRVIAGTGDILSNTGSELFSTIELPQVGTETGIFYSFNQSGTTGIWIFDHDDADPRPRPIIQTTSPPEDNSAVFVNSESFVTNQRGDVVYIRRQRGINDFFEGVHLSETEFSHAFSGEVVIEGTSAPGAGEDATFNQFNTVQVTANGGVLYEASASVNGFWFQPAGGSNRKVLIEGEALPGLAANWRDTGSRRMISRGVTDDGTLLFFLADYRRTLQNGTEETGGGIWLLAPTGNVRIAQTDMLTPDLFVFTDLFSPSMNASGQVAFYAHSEAQIGNELIRSEAIWKTNANGELVVVAEPRNIVGPDNIELVAVSQPIMQPDGNVIFVGTAFDDTNSIISLVLRETSVGIEVLARTDALPTPDGNVSVVPNAIQQMATNRHGGVVFQLDFNDDVWLRSPDGSFNRIVGKGDSIEVATGTIDGVVAKKTVNFIEFVGGATTDMGLPTGFSDDSDVTVKVTFADGTEAILLATVSDDDLLS